MPKGIPLSHVRVVSTYGCGAFDGSACLCWFCDAVQVPMVECNTWLSVQQWTRAVPPTEPKWLSGLWVFCFPSLCLIALVVSPSALASVVSQ